MQRGAFLITEENDKLIFAPKEEVDEIPEDQLDLMEAITECQTTIHIFFKGIRNYGQSWASRTYGRGFKKNTPMPPAPEETPQYYIQKLMAIAKNGLEKDKVHVKLALSQTKLLQDELVLTEGRKAKNWQLFNLASYNAPLAILLLIFYVLTQHTFIATKIPFAPESLETVRAYLLLGVGATIGLWVSIAVGRNTLKFEDLANMGQYHLEIWIRLIFVLFITLIFGLILDTSIIDFTVGTYKLGINPEQVKENLLIGIILGFSEKTLPTRLVELTQKVTRSK